MTPFALLSFLATAAAAAAPAASADGVSLVLIVANNRSAQLSRPPLQYAAADGAKYHEVFASLAGEENTVLLTDLDRDSARLFPQLVASVRSPTRANVDQAASELAQKAAEARKAGQQVRFYFVFAGHGDVDQGRGFLELVDGPLTSDDLDALLRRIDASEAHVVLDSCNSFFVMNPRKPGGRRFATPRDAAENLARRLPNVGVFLSTSAEAEVYEWSELQSGVFSHAVRSGLLGAADVRHDGRITYQELAAFVETATAEIKNPLFRPKVFAYGPNGDNDRILFDLSRTHAVALKVDDPGAVRLVARDSDGTRWLDAYKEPGDALELRFPASLAGRLEVARLKTGGPDAGAVEARYAVPAAEHGPVRLSALAPTAPTSEARGVGDVFRALFARPFGPNALAAYLEERARAPEPVYGISREEAERMGLLLAQLADTERQKRHVTAATGLAVGAAWGTYFGLAAHDRALRRDEKTGATVGALVLPALFLGGGVYQLAHESDGEKVYRRFRAAMAAPGADQSRIAAETDASLQAILEDEHSLRKRRLILGWLTTGLLAAGGIYNETATAKDVSHDGRIMWRSYWAVGTAAFLALTLSEQVSTSPTEKLVELWQKDPDRARLPSLSIAPMPGGGMFVLSGQF
jgi:hypothetical protein